LRKIEKQELKKGEQKNTSKENTEDLQASPNGPNISTVNRKEGGRTTRVACQDRILWGNGSDQGNKAMRGKDPELEKINYFIVGEGGKKKKRNPRG